MVEKLEVVIALDAVVASVPLKDMKKFNKSFPGLESSFDNYLYDLVTIKRTKTKTEYVSHNDHSPISLFAIAVLETAGITDSLYEQNRKTGELTRCKNLLAVVRNYGDKKNLPSITVCHEKNNLKLSHTFGYGASKMPENYIAYYCAMTIQDPLAEICVFYKPDESIISAVKNARKNRVGNMLRNLFT